MNIYKNKKEYMNLKLETRENEYRNENNSKRKKKKHECKNKKTRI